ncbi:hypothetical protein SAMN05421505_10513 [Sinosporangium album]|uniref:Uncharacterized protein n=1 Tax=Sinosporangium album TaxID=504805 RepID=A0A1G7UX24_9ACTN|nr:hypothetical protein SAMN05421505_10513 [Sinosporangium album]
MTEIQKTVFRLKRYASTDLSFREPTLQALQKMLRVTFNHNLNFADHGGFYHHICECALHCRMQVNFGLLKEHCRPLGSVSQKDQYR